MLLPTKITKNTLTQDDIDLLIEESSENVQRDEYTQSWEGSHHQKKMNTVYYWDWLSKPKIVDMLKSKLLPDIIDPAVVDLSFKLASYLPVGLHNDTDHINLNSDERSWYQIVIPLTKCKASTISFNQHSMTRDWVVFKEKASQVPTANKMDPDYFNKNLNHLWEDDRNYLSIDTEFEWNPGDVFYFDVRKYHASDNFKNNGIDEKTCLTLLTKIKKDDYNKYIDSFKI
jgi:hypothetical protein